MAARPAAVSEEARQGSDGGAPAAAPARLAGVVDRVLFERAETGYRVLRVRAVGEAEPVVVVGTLPPAEPGEIVRAEGAWYLDRAWGRQFRASSVTVDAPVNEAGLLAYLSSGRIKGVGEELAHRLVEHFGARLGEVIEKEPLRLREVEGVGPKLATRLHEAWVGQRRARDALVFLAGHGLGAGRAAKILEAYGQDAVAVVSRDPYALARDIRGIGFSTADAIARGLGIAEDAPQRTGAAMAEVLRRAADDGHTALPLDEARARLGGLLQVEQGTVEAGIAREVRAGRLVELEAGEGTGPLLMLGELDRAEGAVAARLRELAAGEPPWSAGDPAEALARSAKALGVALAPSQEAAIRLALVSRALVITGGPGTGKTTLVRGILAALDEPGLKTVLAAPTGRAARRLGESTGREAATLHRLLEAEPERGFRRHSGRPLEADLVIVDEASMVDTALMAGLVEALPPHAALVLVGDVDQLPSIGPGQVLADVIASGAVPVVALTEIFRQAAESAIVRNAHRINRGEPPVFARGAGDGGALADFYGIRVASPEAAEGLLLELLTQRIPERFGFDPSRDVQVLTPMNRGRLGTQALNELLQRHLNPDPPLTLQRGQTRFALGDKVMQLENDHEREVYNGDVGRVTGIDPQARTLEVTMDGRPLRYAQDELERLAVAYAVTVHKAQGSEYPAVVLPVLRQHGRMLRRNLLYTAITRARRLVVLLTEPEALERAVRDAADLRRITLLRQRLADPRGAPTA